MADKSLRRLTMDYILVLLLDSLERASGKVPPFTATDFDQLADDELEVYLDRFEALLRAKGGRGR